MQLVLNTYGTSLQRENEGLVVTTSDGSRQRLPIAGIDSIQISKGAQISSDAVALAIENEVEIFFVDKTGNVIGRIWSPKYGSVSTIRKGQLNFSFSHDAVLWIREVLQRKIENQQALLLSLADEKTLPLVERSIRRLEDYRTKVGKIDGEIVQDVAAQLRGWEGAAARIYFEAYSTALPEAYRFAERSQHPATDIANAMLNYGYGLLYGKIESALIKAGIDPYIGILHRDDYNRPVLVYDVIELYRVWIEYVVYHLLSQGIVSEEYFSVKQDGAVWLEPLGRRVLIQSVNDYLDEVVSVNGLSRSRETQIFLYVQSLAQKFKQC